MEDFSTLIWIVVMAVAAIASRGRKGRTRPAGQSETEPARPTDTASNPTPSGWPAWPQIPGFPDLPARKEPAPQQTTAVPKNPGKHMQPARNRDTAAPRENGGKNRTAQPTHPEKRAQNTAVPVQKRSGNSASGQNEASGAEIAADFDLRKAVIYAEILKPKFDE